MYLLVKRSVYYEKLIKTHIPKSPNKENITLLELACGNGRLLHNLHDYGYVNVQGIDISKELLLDLVIDVNTEKRGVEISLVEALRRIAFKQVPVMEHPPVRRPDFFGCKIEIVQLLVVRQQETLLIPDRYVVVVPRDLFISHLYPAKPLRS